MKTQLGTLLLVLCTACSAQTPDPKTTPPPGTTGSDTPDAGTVTTSNLTATQFLAGEDNKDCDEAFTCMSSFVPTTAGDTFDDEWDSTAQECYADSATEEMVAVVESEIVKGNIVFDPVSAATCLAGIAYPSCSAFWSTGATYPDACDDALYGNTADGGVCLVDYDCAGTDTTDSVCTAGKCAPDTSARRAPQTRYGAHLAGLHASKH